MSAQVVPVTFPNKRGEQLFGILHRPERPRADAAILLLSPGVKMRVAPHRLYNKMTARFVALGYPVLRFDFHGLGDSAGDAPDRLLADLYGATQVGRYVDDTVAAMDWMQKTHGTARFVAAGLCGGALTGLLAAQNDPRITSLLGLSIPVILDGSNIDATRYMTMAQLQGTRNRYLRKLRLWKPDVWRSWWRLLTMQSHYSLILKSFTKPLAEKIRRPAETPAAAAPTPVQDNTNPHFAPAFERMLSTSRRMLLIFAESDRLLHDFEVKFRQRHQPTIDRYKDYYDVHIVPKSNHVYSFPEWQEEMLGRACQWLERALPERVAAAAR